MRELRDPGGRFPYRPWYDERTIDQMMEDELARAGWPTLAGRAAIDIDAFVERYLKLVPQFVPLPPGIQGATDYFPDGSVVMKIAADLAERADLEVAAERLLRTTFAHEAAHVILHRVLFLKESATLFREQASRTELCRDIRFVGGYTGEWWEWQANRGMAALLLPRSRVIQVVQSRRASSPPVGAADLERELSDAFAVSCQAARYRLEQLKMVGDARQPGLGI